jgi:alpha-glucoside transport system substrate-binding protein
MAKALIAAGDDFRYDMSDQMPQAFGGTPGKGEWKDLQDFLKNPKDIAGAQAKLEADAAKAYGG